MASVEIFCRNVKTVLTQRSIRIKDLAERIGLSESYLSLVLNGLRKNLNDEYKDRIASYLNLSLSQLYSEDLGVTVLEVPAPVFVEDPDRKETAQLVETFLTATNLSHSRPSFYVALSSMNDKESRTVRTFLRNVLADLAKYREAKPSAKETVTSLTDAEKSFLAISSLAGDEARLEWIKSACPLEEPTFTRALQGLAAGNLISVRDDAAMRRISTQGVPIQPSAIFTLTRLRDIHALLAEAMVTLPDEGPFYEKRVAEHFVKAGRNREALEHQNRAARLLEDAGLWREAAATWHQSSILCGVLDDTVGRSNSLAEAAKCLGAAGDFDGANEFGNYACRVIQEMGKPRSVGYVCIMMGYMLGEHDPNAAIDWYRKGLKVIDLDDANHGILLGNLISTLLEADRLDEAENTIREARRWSAGRSEQYLGNLKMMIPLGLGLIEFRRRNWRPARTHFEDALVASEGLDRQRALVLQNIGMLMYRDDNQKAATDHLSEAQDIYLGLGLKTYSAYVGIELAKVSLRQGDFDEAARKIGAAEPLLEEKSALEKGWVHLLRSCVARNKNRQAEAIEFGRKAVDVFHREEAERELALAALWMSDLCSEAGDSQQATFMERRAFQVYEKRHWDVRELRRERALLEPGRG